MKRLTKLFWFIFALFLTSCSTAPITPDRTAAWERRQTELRALDSWQVNSSIAVKGDKGAWSARVFWQQQPTTYQLRFNVAGGQGVVLLDGTPTQVQMRTADRQQFVAPTPDILMKDVLKVDVPVSFLRYWIRGIPSPKERVADYQLNENNQLSYLRQVGWKVEFTDYSNVQGYSLPQRLILENDEFKVKILISQWQLKAGKK